MIVVCLQYQLEKPNTENDTIHNQIRGVTLINKEHLPERFNVWIEYKTIQCKLSGGLNSASRTHLGYNPRI